MFIHVPMTRYTATAEGAVVKDVTCERRGHTYAYPMARVVTGSHKVPFSSSRGPEKAAANARANLAWALDAEHDDVPCPECRWHQPAQVASVRGRLYPDLRSLAGAFFYLASLAFGAIVFFIVVGILVMPDHELPRPYALLQFSRTRTGIVGRKRTV
jgi:hypothetical protein